MFTVMAHLFCDSNLRFIVLVRVGVAAVHDYRGIFKSHFYIIIIEVSKILKVIVGLALTVFVYISAEDCVSVGVTFAFYFPTTINKHMR